ncbi:phosphate uptake regulator, PhoU [Acidothermus cellulolyticus 11B]|jgi:phosphate transport system protein|uniref:Phosphate-specific transport system accessory protein PhoU n=1 Tax=Acidothermus cellulolyticus (strain ATCC 43068 / DSM 8971 / 11B) TaxID=351607 RepID=A0LR06_ACIC1|nr:phosphate signaling complex protein PhoU [Acidothermus cellulolyticus]ABK51866.1 phosphate uptake regulator, PhoU [Acidothermus cellulolyticus 11B]
MRDAYHEELDALRVDMVDLARRVRTAMSRASRALLEGDLAVAEEVIDGDDDVDQMRRDIERRIVDLIARQQPVASDLRVLTAGLRIVADLERAGDHAVHLAKLARRRYPMTVVPEPLRPVIARMGEAAVGIAGELEEVLATADAARAASMERHDDTMDALHRALLREMLETPWSYGVDTAIDLAYASRYFERYADHLVSAARHVNYQVTGQWTAEVGDLA